MSRPCILVCSWYRGKEWRRNLLKSLKGVLYPIVIVINGSGNFDMVEISSDLIEVTDISEATFSNIIRCNPNQYTSYYMNPIDGYEIGALKVALEATSFDEFFLVQDTCQFKNLDVLDILFKKYEGTSIQWGHKFQSYLGKYRREMLEKMEIPEVTSKYDSLVNEEKFTQAYLEADPNTIELFPQFSDFIDYLKFSRQNSKNSNQLLSALKPLSS